MIDIGDIVGNIASVCSIIGLPIALYQISGIKSKAEATEADRPRRPQPAAPDFPAFGK